MKLRNRIKRARDAGVTVVELGRDRACPPGLWRRLAEISRAWLTTKGGHELDLLVGEMGEPGDPDRRVFVAFDRQEQPLGFITYVPVWGERPGVLHDLTRRAPDAPAGVMELINATALARFQAEEIRFLHFGFTPFLVGMGGAVVERARPLAGAAPRPLHRPLGPRDLPGAHAAPVQAEVGARDRRDRVHRLPEGVAGRAVRPADRHALARPSLAAQPLPAPGGRMSTTRVTMTRS